MDRQTEACDFLNSAFNSVIEYVRASHAEEIDKTYDFFWEDEDPEDILGGTALGLAFINFEDWLICDYRRKDSGEGFIDLYIKERNPDERTKAVLLAMRDSSLGIYLVKTASEGSVTVEDALLGGEATFSGAMMPNLCEGALFGGRIVMWENQALMGRAVYPFNASALDRAKAFFDKELARYRKKHPEGTLRQMLKEEAYYMNVVWLNCLLTR